MSNHAPEIDYDVGDDVVCIEGQPEGAPKPPFFIPEKGSVYRCTAIVPVPDGTCPGCGGTLAAGINAGSPDVLFCADVFRKVQTVDVAAFLKATKGTPVPKVLEPA